MNSRILGMVMHVNALSSLSTSVSAHRMGKIFISILLMLPNSRLLLLFLAQAEEDDGHDP